MDDANPDEVDGGEYNHEKIIMIGGRLKEFVALNNSSYSFSPSLPIQSALYFGEVLEENELYRISLLREDNSTDGGGHMGGGEGNSIGRSGRVNLSKLFEGDSVFGAGGKKSLNLTETMTDRDWSLVLTGAKPVAFPKEAVIIQEATTNTKFFRIKSGTVNIVKSVEGAKSIVIVTLGPPEVVGEMSVLGGTNLASASVIAANHTVEMYEIKVEFMQRLLNSQPELAERFFKQMACKLSKQLRGMHGGTASDAKKQVINKILGNSHDRDASEVNNAKQKSEKLSDRDAKFRKKFSIKDADEVIIQGNQKTKKPKQKPTHSLSSFFFLLLLLLFFFFP
jgi:CRP-like cAMP-binding protein